MEQSEKMKGVREIGREMHSDELCFLVVIWLRAAASRWKIPRTVAILCSVMPRPCALKLCSGAGCDGA